MKDRREIDLVNSLIKLLQDRPDEWEYILLDGGPGTIMPDKYLGYIGATPKDCFTIILNSSGIIKVENREIDSYKAPEEENDFDSENECYTDVESEENITFYLSRRDVEEEALLKKLTYQFLKNIEYIENKKTERELNTFAKWASRIKVLVGEN